MQSNTHQHTHFYPKRNQRLNGEVHSWNRHFDVCEHVDLSVHQRLHHTPSVHRSWATPPGSAVVAVQWWRCRGGGGGGGSGGGGGGGGGCGEGNQLREGANAGQHTPTTSHHCRNDEVYRGNRHHNVCELAGVDRMQGLHHAPERDVLKVRRGGTSGTPPSRVSRKRWARLLMPPVSTRNETNWAGRRTSPPSLPRTNGKPRLPAGGPAAKVEVALAPGAHDAHVYDPRGTTLVHLDVTSPQVGAAVWHTWLQPARL
jgi:hypothetical protein